jgi:hypothetical protein
LTIGPGYRRPVTDRIVLVNGLPGAGKTLYGVADL